VTSPVRVRHEPFRHGAHGGAAGPRSIQQQGGGLPRTHAVETHQDTDGSVHHDPASNASLNSWNVMTTGSHSRVGVSR